MVYNRVFNRNIAIAFQILLTVFFLSTPKALAAKSCILDGENEVATTTETGNTPYSARRQLQQADQGVHLAPSFMYMAADRQQIQRPVAEIPAALRSGIPNSLSLLDRASPTSPDASFVQISGGKNRFLFLHTQPMPGFAEPFQTLLFFNHGDFASQVRLNVEHARNDQKKWLVEDGSVYVHLHGGGTATASGANGLSIGEVQAPYGVPTISIDLPGHGLGTRIPLVSNRETLEWVMSLVHDVVKPGVKIILGGHSYGAELAAYAQLYLSDSVTKDVVHYVAMSPPLDNSDGQGASVRREKEEAQEQNVEELVERIAPSDYDFMVNMVLHGKVCLLPSFNCVLGSFDYDLSTNRVLQLAQDGQLKPLTTIMGEYDGLVYVGNEAYWPYFESASQNGNAILLGEGKTFKGDGVKTGHNIFDIESKAASETLPKGDTYREILLLGLRYKFPENSGWVQAIDEQIANNTAARSLPSGSPEIPKVELPMGNDYPAVKLESEPDILNIVLGEYINNRGFRIFADSFGMRVGQAQPALIELQKRASAYKRVKSTVTKNGTRVFKQRWIEEQNEILKLFSVNGKPITDYSLYKKMQSNGTALASENQETFAQIDGALAQLEKSRDAVFLEILEEEYKTYDSSHLDFELPETFAALEAQIDESAKSTQRQSVPADHQHQGELLELSADIRQLEAEARESRAQRDSIRKSESKKRKAWEQAVRQYNAAVDKIYQTDEPLPESLVQRQNDLFGLLETYSSTYKAAMQAMTDHVHAFEGMDLAAHREEIFDLAFADPLVEAFSQAKDAFASAQLEAENHLRDLILNGELETHSPGLQAKLEAVVAGEVYGTRDSFLPYGPEYEEWSQKNMTARVAADKVKARFDDLLGLHFDSQFFQISDILGSEENLQRLLDNDGDANLRLALEKIYGIWLEEFTPIRLGIDAVVSPNFPLNLEK